MVISEEITLVNDLREVLLDIVWGMSWVVYLPFILIIFPEPPTTLLREEMAYLTLIQRTVSTSLMSWVGCTSF